MTSPTNLTREQVIAQVVSELEGPTPLEVVVDRVLERKPSRAKDTRSPIRSDIRLRAASLGIVFADLERKIVVPAHVALRGVRFRHLVTSDEAGRRTLLWDESDTVYMPSVHHSLDFNLPDVQLVDAEGQAIAWERTTVKTPSHLDYGPPFLQVTGCKMPNFFRSHSVKAGDSFLFTIEQFDPPRWRLEHEPQAQRNQAAIDRRNRELMDILYQMLEEAPAEYLHDEQTAVRSALIQTADPHGYPGDPWLQALDADGRMAPDMHGIVYADSRPLSLDDIFDVVLLDNDEAYPPTVEEIEELPPLPEGAGERVYTFKVSSADRPRLWRRIEVLGAEMLAELNRFLVELFKHDDDHLGGFWRIVQRGRSRRTREVELAAVDPLGSGPGGETRIAELDLAAGDVLKWVYDFGDWNEYKLQLETVADPAAPPAVSVEYPRVVAANQPELLYCTSCQARGKQTVAVWCCWDCSDEQGETVMLCEECSRLPQHDEHYLQEWVY